MCQPSWPIVLAIASALLAGCATSSIEMAPDQPDRPWVPATNAAGEIIPGAKASPEQAAGATMSFRPIPSLPRSLPLGSTVLRHIHWRI